MNWALVVHEETSMAEVLGGIVEEKLPGCKAVTAKNFTEASTDAIDRYGMGECQMLVLGFGAPSNALEAPSIEGNRAGAFAFFESIRTRWPDLPCVFLTRVVDAATQQKCATLKKVSLLKIQTIYRTLAEAIDIVVLEKASAARCNPHDVDVDITLRLAGPCTWGMSGAGGNALEEARVFAISEEQIEELIQDSEDLATNAKRHLLERIGKKMYKTLFSNSLNSADFELVLYQNIRSRDDNRLEAARFRFHLDHGTNKLLVETLAKPSGKNDGSLHFWMLDAPIYRKFGNVGKRTPLFKDRSTRDAPIDCLVIQGRADAFTTGAPVSAGFNPIPLAAKEVGWLQKYWTNPEVDLKIGKVEFMRPEAYVGQSYGNAVRAALRARPWHLIHYAGHSCIAGQRAFLVLGDGRDDLLDIDVFAAEACSAQFVFMNSCSSANATFISRLVEKSIPAVVGYAWPVGDRAALAFSTQFYTELFEGELSTRFLEYSFMRGKAHLFRNAADKAAWAAPLLFMQTRHADQD